MKVTRKGQVTIPQAIRKRAGMPPGTEVEFSIDDEGHDRLAPKGNASAAGVRAAVSALRGRAGDARHRGDHRADARRIAALIDSSLLIDVATGDPDWPASAKQMKPLVGGEVRDEALTFECARPAVSRR